MAALKLRRHEPDPKAKTHKITFGKSERVFYTRHHAEQFTQALMLNGTPYQWFIDGVLYEEFEQ